MRNTKRDEHGSKGQEIKKVEEDKLIERLNRQLQETEKKAQKQAKTMDQIFKNLELVMPQHKKQYGLEDSGNLHLDFESGQNRNIPLK